MQVESIWSFRGETEKSSGAHYYYLRRLTPGFLTPFEMTFVTSFYTFLVGNGWYTGDNVKSQIPNSKSQSISSHFFDDFAGSGDSLCSRV